MENKSEKRMLPIYSFLDEVVQCPICGVRTDFFENEDGSQKHTCLGCQYEFIVELENDID